MKQEPTLQICNTWLETLSKIQSCAQNQTSAIPTLQSHPILDAAPPSLQTSTASGPTQPSQTFHGPSLHSLQLGCVSLVLTGHSTIGHSSLCVTTPGLNRGKGLPSLPAGNTREAAKDLAGKGLFAFFHFSMLLLPSAQVWDGSLVAEHCFYMEEHWQGCSSSYTPGWMYFWPLFFIDKSQFLTDNTTGT